MELGIAFVPTLPPERLRELAVTAETAGLDELWVWEDCSEQSGVASATAPAWTSADPGRHRVDAGAVAESLPGWGRAGVTSVAVHPTADEPDLPGPLHFLGEGVRPLVG